MHGIPVIKEKNSFSTINGLGQLVWNFPNIYSSWRYDSTFPEKAIGESSQMIIEFTFMKKRIKMWLNISYIFPF